MDLTAGSTPADDDPIRLVNGLGHRPLYRHFPPLAPP